MTVRQLTELIRSAILPVYDEDEAVNVARLITRHITGMDAVRLTLERDMEVTAETELLAEKYIQQLLSGKPVQYVLNEAHFFDMDLFVDERVLIPRPETEELLFIIRKEMKNPPHRAIDLCTGSGCIALALKKMFPTSEVLAVDVSTDALEVAKENSNRTGLAIRLIHDNVLDPQSDVGMSFDLIVSNPPYVRLSESASMHERVLDHEPHLALFVPDNDPLVFYRSIFSFASRSLNPGGMIALEINESEGTGVAGLASEHLINGMIRKDLFGKDRFFVGVKTGR